MPDPAEVSQDANFQGPPIGASPEFRTWYSSNPAFVDGSDTSPTRAANTLFATSPEIVEAVEAIHQRKTGEEPLASLDSKLAMKGLKTIRKSRDAKDDAPKLREDAIETRDHLRTAEEKKAARQKAEQDEQVVETQKTDDGSPQAENQEHRGVSSKTRQDFENTLSSIPAARVQLLEIDGGSIEELMDLSDHFAIDGTDN